VTSLTKFAVLRSLHGTETEISFDFPTFFAEIAERGDTDLAIVGSEDGFSPLGASKDFFEQDLQIPYRSIIKPLVEWNHKENPRISLLAIKSKNPNGLLRGIVVAPTTNSISYRNLRHSGKGGPLRSFFYNVTYEALVFATQQWHAKRISLSHLSPSGSFHPDIATCHAEALAHFCDDEPLHAPSSFVFCGCCINPKHLEGIKALNSEADLTRHRTIHVEVELVNHATLVHLNWQNQLLVHQKGS